MARRRRPSTRQTRRRILAAADRYARALGEIYRATQGHGAAWRAAVRAFAAIVGA
jgi:hypothetical protein